MKTCPFNRETCHRGVMGGKTIGMRWWFCSMSKPANKILRDYNTRKSHKNKWPKNISSSNKTSLTLTKMFRLLQPWRSSSSIKMCPSINRTRWRKSGHGWKACSITIYKISKSYRIEVRIHLIRIRGCSSIWISPPIVTSAAATSKMNMSGNTDN